MADAPQLQAASGSPKAAHEGGRMSVFDHLGELRKRLIYSLVMLAVCAGGCYFVAADIFTFLRLPLRALPSQTMIVLNPLEMFVTYLKISLVAGLFLAMPFVLLQLWLFIAPGLYAAEKKWVIPFVLVGSAFFTGGAAFCFYLVLPASFAYLATMVPQGVEAHYSVSVYLSLIVHLVLAFGLIFELPLIMAIFGAAGLVKAKTFAGFRKYWVIVAAVIGGVLTPTPDPMTQLMMAAPLVLFYELGIVGARAFERRHKRSVGATGGA